MPIKYINIPYNFIYQYEFNCTFIVIVILS